MLSCPGWNFEGTCKVRSEQLFLWRAKFDADVVDPQILRCPVVSIAFSIVHAFVWFFMLGSVLNVRLQIMQLKMFVFLCVSLLLSM